LIYVIAMIIFSTQITQIKQTFADNYLRTFVKFLYVNYCQPMIYT